MTDDRMVGRMNQERRPSRASGLWFGLILVALGLMMTLHRMDIAPMANVGRVWPIAVIGAGAAKMWDTWGTPAAGSGIGLIATGVWFLLVNFKVFGMTYHNAWPLLIVGVGISILWRAFLEERGGRGRREDGDGR